jgi:hypothetical protein
VLLAALVVYPALRSERLGAAVAAVGAGAGFLLVVGLALRWSSLVPWAVALVGGEYAFSLLVTGGRMDPLAPVFAGGLFLLAEFSYWAMERETVREEPGLLARRLATVLVTTVGVTLVAALVLVFSDTTVGGGLALEAIGVAAAAGALAIVALLARRHALPG